MPFEVLLAFSAVFGLISLVVGLDRLIRPDRKNVERRLRRYGGRAYQLTDEEQRQAASVQVTQLLAKQVERSISGRSFAEALQEDLARANLKFTVAEFLILQASSAVIIGALASVISGTPIVGSIFGIAGWFLPRMWMGRRQAQRLKAFNEQLPDFLTLMGNSLRSGMSLVQSMELISREAGPPVSEELQRVVREIGLGISPQDALRHLVRRVNSDDLDLIVTAILVQFEVGGNLARVLDSIAGTIRERVKLKGEIRTMSAQGRASGYILSGLPVAVGGLLMLIAPNYIGALFTPGPWLALPIIAVIGIVFGGLVIRRLVDIEI